MHDIMASLQRSREVVPSETSASARQPGADAGIAKHAGRWGPPKSMRCTGLGAARIAWCRIAWKGRQQPRIQV